MTTLIGCILLLLGLLHWLVEPLEAVLFSRQFSASDGWAGWCCHWRFGCCLVANGTRPSHDHFEAG